MNEETGGIRLFFLGSGGHQAGQGKCAAPGRSGEKFWIRVRSFFLKPLDLGIIPGFMIESEDAHSAVLIHLMQTHLLEFEVIYMKLKFRTSCPTVSEVWRTTRCLL